jgi:peptide-methionine (S)-S-oxide reductase
MIRRAVLAAALALAALPAATQPASAQRLEVATFAGGCFWCMEQPFDVLPGVASTTSGYTGGTTANPTYRAITAGGTGHYEAVQIRFDPTKVTYETLLEVFWRNVDPVDAGGQFCDRGDHYRTAIFAHDEAQRTAAEASKARLAESGRLPGPVVTPVLPASTFTPAEEYHQDYATKNPLRYRFYRTGCGRDARLQAIWGAEAGGKQR